jgi:hypothetical protein
VCRWLLELRDRCDSDVIPLTQGFLAHMVGVQRTTVTQIASKLQASGAIRCRRGRIRILDAAKLEGDACECYGRVKLLVDTISPPLVCEPALPEPGIPEPGMEAPEKVSGALGAAS